MNVLESLLAGLAVGSLIGIHFKLLDIRNELRKMRKGDKS